MFDDWNLTYVCAACAHRFEAAEQPCQCPKCRVVGKARDFPSAETAEIARQNDLFRLGIVAGMPEGMKGHYVVTPGIRALGRDFETACYLAVSAFKDFSEDNDPCGDRGFAALIVNDIRVYWKIDLYDADCVYGSEEPTDPERTTRVLTILLPSEY